MVVERIMHEIHRLLWATAHTTDDRLGGKAPRSGPMREAAAYRPPAYTGHATQYRLQCIGGKTLNTCLNARATESGLRSSTRLNKRNLFPTLPAGAVDTHGRGTKRQDVFPAGTGPIDLETSVYESHHIPPLLAVTVSRGAYRADITHRCGTGKQCVNRGGRWMGM